MAATAADAAAAENDSDISDEIPLPRSRRTSSLGGSKSPDLAYKVLYTPKRLLSEEDDLPDPNVDQIVNTRVADRRSLPHVKLFVTEGRVNVASNTRLSFPLIRASMDLDSGPHSPTQQRSSSERSQNQASNPDLNCIDPPIVRRRSLSTKKVRWPGGQNENDQVNKCGSRFPPDVRVKLVERLMELKTLIIDMVVHLNSIGFGGSHFEWNRESLNRYSITLPEKIKVPDEFKKFASIL